MSADARSGAGGKADWPRKAIGLPAYLVKDWGTTLRAAVLVIVGRLTAGSLGASDAVERHLAGAFEAVQLSGAWLPWSILGCVGTAEAARRIHAALAGRRSSAPAALGAAPGPGHGKGATGKKGTGKRGRGKKGKGRKGK